MDLVLLRLSALGDILRVLPAWVNLHEAFPRASLRAVVEDRHAFLLQPFPWLEVVPVHRRELTSPGTALRELRRVAREVVDAEVSLDFHGILKSALIPWLAGIPERWGDGVTKEGAGLLQTHRVPFQVRSRYEQALGLVDAFGVHHGVRGLGRFRPVLRGVELPEVPSVWETDGRPRAVFVPGTSRRGAHKRWPLRHWRSLVRRLEKRWQLRWAFGPEEADLREWLPAETGVPALPPCSFWELASLLRQADRVVVPDTGILHLAVLLGIPVVALFGPSDPVIAGIPRGSGVVLRTGIGCSPCRERGCLRRDCLEQLEPERVLAALEG